MNLRFWRGWGVGRRMAVITMLPVILLFTSFVWYSWYAHRAQVAEELAERGRILARALSENRLIHTTCLRIGAS
jgi:two-component system sensor histidine kinase UhpB